MEWAKGTVKTAIGKSNGDEEEGTDNSEPNPTNPATEISSTFKPDSSIVWQGLLVYVVLAAGSTLPWWILIAAADYFEFLYPEVHVIRYFTLAYYGSWVIAYILVARFWRHGTSWVKINLGLSVAFIALLVIPLMDGIFISNQGTTATFWVTLLTVAIAGCADAVAQGSVLGVSAELPESFSKAYVSGAALSGVFVFIVRVITKACLSSSAKGLRISARIYFPVSALFLVLVIALFAYIHYMPAMSYYNSLNLGSIDTVRLLIQDEGTVPFEVAAGAAIASIASGRPSPTKPLLGKSVLGSIRLLAVAVAVTSMVSMIIFPGYLSEDVHSSKLGSWYPLLLLGTYAIFDLLGRLLTTYVVLKNHFTILGAAGARLILVVLLILELLHGPGFVTSMLSIFLLTAILGLSNGFLIATLLMLMPRVTPAREAESVGVLSTLFMNMGLLVGAGLSFLLILAA